MENCQIGCPLLKTLYRALVLALYLYIIFASDLKLRSTMNLRCKYADDTTLMIPQNTDVCLEDEFKHVVQWSAQK
jgi:hypothetical protein